MSTKSLSRVNLDRLASLDRKNSGSEIDILTVAASSKALRSTKALKIPLPVD
jgi:hypothetical protein